MECVPVNLSDRASPKEFRVYCGGCMDYFKYDLWYKRPYLRKVLEARINLLNTRFFPGLILEGTDGTLYHTVLKAVLEPISAEEQVPPEGEQPTQEPTDDP